MRERCENPKHQAYGYYGGRGITVCERWLKFENFLADMGERPHGMTLDRKDSNGNYEHGNCRWASRLEQSNNTRSNLSFEVGGERKTVAEWARAKGMPYARLHGRLKLGWQIERALSQPAQGS